MKGRMAKIGVEGVQAQVLATSDADLRKLGPFEFQNWILQRVNATPAARVAGDMGIDGLSFVEHLPVQIKQRERVGREGIDSSSDLAHREGPGLHDRV